MTSTHLIKTLVREMCLREISEKHSLAAFVDHVFISIDRMQRLIELLQLDTKLNLTSVTLNLSFDVNSTREQLMNVLLQRISSGLKTCEIVISIDSISNPYCHDFLFFHVHQSPRKSSGGFYYSPHGRDEIDEFPESWLITQSSCTSINEMDPMLLAAVENFIESGDIALRGNANINVDLG